MSIVFELLAVEVAFFVTPLWRLRWTILGRFIFRLEALDGRPSFYEGAIDAEQTFEKRLYFVPASCSELFGDLLNRV